TRLPSDLRVFPLFEKGHFTGDDKTSQFSLFNAAGRLSVQSSRDFWLGPQSGEKHQVSIGRAVGLEDGRLVVVHRSVGFSWGPSLAFILELAMVSVELALVRTPQLKIVGSDDGDVNARLLSDAPSSSFGRFWG